MANFHDQYRAYFENANEAIFLIAEERFVDCNPKAEELFDCSSDQILSRTPADFSPERQPDGRESREKARDMVQSVLSGAPRVFEWVHLRNDGSPFYAEVRLSKVEIQGVPHVLALMHDISEQKQDEEELELSREKYRTLVNNAQTGVFLLQDYRIRFVNQAFTAMVGYDLDELIGSDFRDLVLVEDEHDSCICSNDAEGANQSVECDIRMKQRNGSMRLVHLRASNISYRGEPAVMGTVMDITETDQSEQLQRALYRISESTHSAKDPEALYKQIHSVLEDLMPAKNMYIALYDETNDKVSFPYYVDEIEPRPAPRKDGKGLTEYVLQSDRPFLVSESDLQSLVDEGVIERSGHPAVDWLGVPLKVGDRTLGVLTVQNYDRGVRYGDREKMILSFVSDQVAMTIARKQAEEQLRKLSNAVEKTADLVYITNTDGVIEYVNSSFEKHTGYSREDVIGRTPSFLNSSEYGKDFYEEIWKQLQQGEIYHGELLHETKSGEHYYHDQVVTPVKSETGEITHYISTGRDVTEQKKMEQVRNAILRISEAAHETRSLDELYRTIHQIVQYLMPAENFYIALYDAENDQLRFPYFVDQYDESPIGPQETRNGLTEYVIRHEEPVLGSQREIRKLAETGEIEIKGSLPRDWLGVPLKTEHETIGVLAVQSYTEGVQYSEREKEILTFVSNQIAMTIARKQTEALLSAERERLAVTLRSIGEGVITTDREGKVILMNRTAERLTGWSSRESYGRHLSDVFNAVDEKTEKPVNVAIQNVIESGSAQDLPYEVILISKDESERYITEAVAPLRDDESEIIGAVLVFSDVTETRKLEREVSRSQKLESVGILAGGIAHDFNNILSGIIGNLSLARLSADQPEKLEELLREAENGSKRAAKLTKQLLTFSKGGAPVKETAKIEELIRESVSFALRGSNVRPKIVLPEDLWPVEVDTGQIDQVLQNLVINADQAMPDGGIILIEAENHRVQSPANIGNLEPGNYIKIQVRDSGSGIKKEHLEKIFDPYFTTKTTGTGLGLATSYSIIQKHGGVITADSMENEGTTITIYLPASTKPKPNPVSSAKSVSNIQWSPGGKVLLMDDEEAVKAMASNMLQTLGFTVEQASTGEEAIQSYQAAKDKGSPFDAVILDLTIPGGMGGKEAINKLRQIDPQVNAIVSSGYSTDPIMADYQAYGFREKIEKPYNIEEMIETLNTVMGTEVGTSV